MIVPMYLSLEPNYKTRNSLDDIAIWDLGSSLDRIIFVQFPGKRISWSGKVTEVGKFAGRVAERGG